MNATFVVTIEVDDDDDLAVLAEDIFDLIEAEHIVVSVTPQQP